MTKFFPASDVRLLADLGVRDVGENRHQEAVEKAAECADLDLRWHFIGALQSNKAAAVAGYADVVHSVDRAKLVGGLSRGAQERGRELDCLVQVSLDPPEASGRSGAAAEEVPALAERILEADGLRLRGVMGVAPLGGDPARRSTSWPRQAAVVRRLEPEATWISAGMSGDLEEAIAAVRHTCGSAQRSSVRGRSSSSVRSAARPAVASGRQAPREQRKSTNERDAEDGRLPRPARGRGRRLRRPRQRVRRARPPLRAPRRARAGPPVANLAERRRPAREVPTAATTTVAPMSRITTLHPRTYNEARVIGENFRDGVPVIMNLSEMDDTDAKRLVDFAAGLVFSVRGTIERVTNKVFLLSPPNVSVAAEDKQRIAEGGFFNQS